MRLRAHPALALSILTALNFFNYIDRYVLPAVQPDVQREFHVTDAEIGFLTTAFFLCYIVAAPLMGLARNPAFWTATLGMAMYTFSIGGLSVWMPTFLSRVRGIPLKEANLSFGLITLFNGIVATLIGGWLGDKFLKRKPGAYYVLSAFAMAAGIIPMAIAIYVPGRAMFPAIFVVEFLIFLNTGPLNAAIVNSVGAHI